MAKVLGVGGIFFKSPNPRRLMAWYQAHLNMPAENADYANLFPASMPFGSSTVFSPFIHTTQYFAPSSSAFMLNLVVDDLNGALGQVAAAGASLVGDVQTFEYGRFGWFIDPDGNKIELWEPSGTA